MSTQSAQQIMSVLPATGGNPLGGTLVTVFGSGLSSVTSVTFGGQPATALKVISLGQFSCAQSSSSPYPAPDPGGCGFSDASVWQLLQGCVLTAGGTALKDDNGRPLNVDLDTCLAADPSSIPTPPSATTPVVNSIDPTSGSPQGEDQVTVSYSRFKNVTGVGFGSVDAPNVAFMSDQQVIAISLPGSGTVEIQVVTPGDVSPKSPFDQFAYT